MELVENHENRLEALRWHFLQDLDNGSALSPDEYVQDDPEIAEALFDFIVDFLRMEAAAARVPYPTTASSASTRARRRALECIAVERKPSP